MKKETYGLYRELIGNALAHFDDLVSLRTLSRSLLATLAKEADDGSSPEERIRQAVMLEKCAWAMEKRLDDDVKLIRALFSRDIIEILKKHAGNRGTDYDSFVKGRIQLWIEDGNLYGIPPKSGRILVRKD